MISMKWYCKLIGHTFVYKTQMPKVSWNTGKDQAELHMTAEGPEPACFLECARCGAVVHDPSPEQVKLTGCNAR